MRWNFSRPSLWRMPCSAKLPQLHDYDWKEADEQFALARASESVSLSVHDMYAGAYLSPLGRFEEALQQTEK